MRTYLSGGGDVRAAALRRFAVSISLFTIAGHVVLGFEQAWVHPFVGVTVACGAELVLERAQAWSDRREPRYRGGGLLGFTDFLLPPWIAGLALSMLLYPNERLSPIAFAAAVCAGSKYLLRVRVKGRPRHFLNPSNAGIAVTLVAFPSVGIAPPYHFTENLSGLLDWAVPLAVLASGLVLNWKLTAKKPLIVAWVVGFAGQAVVRGMLLDVSVVGALLPLTGLAFFLFTTYMITDPGTTPVARRGQVAFGLAVAAVYGLLVTAGIVFGLFFALVLVSAGRGAGLALLAAVRARRLEVVRVEEPGARRAEEAVAAS